MHSTREHDQHGICWCVVTFFSKCLCCKALSERLGSNCTAFLSGRRSQKVSSELDMQRQEEDMSAERDVEFKRSASGSEKVGRNNLHNKMVVKHSFVPCVDDELDVKQGQIVYVIYKENQWVYAMTESGKQGYVPSNYLAEIPQSLDIYQPPKSPKSPSKKHKHRKQRVLPFDSYSTASNKTIGDASHPNHIILQNRSAFIPKERQPSQQPANNAVPSCLTKSLSFGEIELGDYDIFGYISDISVEHSDSEQSLDGSQASTFVEAFDRKNCGKYLVLHSYYSEDENDASVLKGDCVTVLNKEDRDWYFVRTSDSREGFVPRGHLWQATCSPDSEELRI